MGGLDPKKLTARTASMLQQAIELAKEEVCIHNCTDAHVCVYVLLKPLLCVCVCCAPVNIYTDMQMYAYA